MNRDDRSEGPDASASSADAPWLLPRRAAARWVVVVALFVVALGVRVYRIGEPALDFHAARQYRSALIVRAWYLETLDGVPEWRREIAEADRERLGTWEPPILEQLALWSYRIAGHEWLAAPRSLSVLFWVVGGVFVLLLARRIVSADAAFVSAAVYLFLPFGIRASRTFLPDPLMIMMMLWSTYVVLRYWEQPSWTRLLVAAVISAAALMVKSVTVFTILGAFVGAGLAARGVRRLIGNARHWLFAAISVVPAAVYYGYAIFFSGALGGMARGKILPYLLLRPFFWSGWLAIVGQVVGYAAFIGALLGVVLCRGKLARGLLVGLWVGFVVFVLVFSYTTHTHDYWSLQLVPVVALSLGPLAEAILRRLGERRPHALARAATAALLLLALVMGAGVVLWPLRQADFAGRARMMAEIGDVVGHGPTTLLLARDGGVPLRYYGEITGWQWPTRAMTRARLLRSERVRDAEAKLDELRTRFAPEYFIVTDLDEYNAQPELRRLLTSRFPVLTETDEYVIFDLRPAAPSD